MGCHYYSQFYGVSDNKGHYRKAVKTLPEDELISKEMYTFFWSGNSMQVQRIYLKLADYARLKSNKKYDDDADRHGKKISKVIVAFL